MGKDTIYRQDAIDAVIKRDANCGIDSAEVLKLLPSADVQLDTKELVAKIKKGISATNADDVYSCGMRDGMRWCMSLVDDEEPLFENCPSAQPEREKGKWIPISDGYVDIYECNQCGDTEDYERNFCPNCGADMRQSNAD